MPWQLQQSACMPPKATQQPLYPLPKPVEQAQTCPNFTPMKSEAGTFGTPAPKLSEDNAVTVSSFEMSGVKPY